MGTKVEWGWKIKQRKDGTIIIIDEGSYRLLPKVYEGSVVNPATVDLDMNADTGRNSIDGWIINDGPAAMQVSFSRDGVVFSEAWTVLTVGETNDLSKFDIDTLRLTSTGTSAYRILLI